MGLFDGLFGPKKTASASHILVKGDNAKVPITPMQPTYYTLYPSNPRGFYCNIHLIAYTDVFDRFEIRPRQVQELEKGLCEQC